MGLNHLVLNRLSICKSCAILLRLTWTMILSWIHFKVRLDFT